MEARDSPTVGCGLEIGVDTSWGSEGCEAERGLTSRLRLALCRACVLLCTSVLGVELPLGVCGGGGCCGGGGGGGCGAGGGGGGCTRDSCDAVGEA